MNCTLILLNVTNFPKAQLFVVPHLWLRGVEHYGPSQRRAGYMFHQATFHLRFVQLG